MGVEEEFLLLEPDGSVAPRAAEVVRRIGAGDRVKPEYMAYQLETTSSVHTALGGLRRELAALRVTAAEAAERSGAYLVASGAVPLPAGPVDALSEAGRYREIARRFPAATEAGACCGCHVHIGVPDRELATAVLTRLRPWLPALLALTVNSPVSGASDTGWQSYRYPTQMHWPTFRPPSIWPSAERYDQEVSELIEAGTAVDAAGVHFMARLSARFPTIEIRVADTGLGVADAVLFAGAARALVAALIADVRQRVKVLPPPEHLVTEQLLATARGAGASLGDTDRLLAKITPQLDVLGDTGEIYAGFERLRREGTGAARQRRLWRRYGPTSGFVGALAEETAPAVLTR
ncbi:YbdK family carboxylate-amine ligase [Actinoplanes sp. NPDC023714]|uniref:carboxylate-amine ligase n=1 Tax=Actinoplanes sp. NPDC023714 TaxID=3154322 RepID=UPI00340A74AE